MNSGSSKEAASLVSTVVADVQYQLSRCFMNYARDQLVNKQFALMMETNLLLQTLANRVTAKYSDKCDKDFCNVITSQTLDTLNDEDDMPKARQRLFTRKTAHVAPQRLLNPESNFTFALEEIKENCSTKTFSTVTNIMESYAKLKKNANQIKSQLNTSGSGIIRSRPDTERSNNDQSLIMTARYLKMQKENALLNQKIKELEEKLAKASTQPSKQPPDQIKSYITSREKQLLAHQQRIKLYHDNIINGLQERIIEEGCNRCCVLVKRIKDSLINYKECLTQQMNTYRTLWQKLHLRTENEKSQTKSTVKIQS